jgi:hypothetical protein
MTAKQRERERAKARRAFRELSNADRWALNDQLVLGDFDWRDWFYEPPSNVMLNELAALIQNWEETR